MSLRTLATAQPRTFLERDKWIRAVLASGLPDAAARIAIAIGMRLRVKTGRCNPSYIELASESHVSERSSYRLVDLLEHQGWIIVQRTRGRQANQYILVNPANPTNPAKVMAGLNPAKAGP